MGKPPGTWSGFTEDEMKHLLAPKRRRLTLPTGSESVPRKTSETSWDKDCQGVDLATFPSHLPLLKSKIGRIINVFDIHESRRADCENNETEKISQARRTYRSRDQRKEEIETKEKEIDAFEE